MRIILGDEQEMRRDGFRCLFEQDLSHSVVGESGSAKGLLAEISANDADVVLIALALSERGGVRLVEEVKELSPGIKVVILSPEDDLAFASKVFEAGASACISYLASFRDVLGVMRDIMLSDATVSVEVLSTSASSAPRTKRPKEKDAVPLVAVSA